MGRIPPYFQPSFVVPYHSYMYQKKKYMDQSEIYICTLISMPPKPSMENPVGLFVILVTFLKLSPPFATCNSQLQGMTAPPPALLFFTHF